MFIILSTFSVILLLKHIINIVIPINHIHDAKATPDINFIPSPDGREALNAPNIILPSIIAWGLNHVTAQAVVKTFIKGISTSVELLSEPFAFIRPIPI